MFITETPIQNHNTKIKYKKTIYPQCNCGAKCHSKFYWNALFIGARGSGKTYSAVQQIKHHEDHDILDKDGNKVLIRTILISPTTQQNEIFKSLKSLDDKDIYEEYSDKILLDIIDDIKAVKEKANQYKEYNDAYKKYVRLNEDQLHRLSDTELRILESHDYNPPSIAFPDLKYKFPPVNIVILDDLLGSDIFSRKSKSIFQNALIKSRHLNIAFQILVQSMKAVPKPVRLNCSIFWLGKFSAMNTILTDIADEVSGVVSKDELEMLYKYAIDKEHGALVIDTTKPKNCWFSANWDTMLQISE